MHVAPAPLLWRDYPRPSVTLRIHRNAHLQPFLAVFPNQYLSSRTHSGLSIGSAASPRLSHNGLQPRLESGVLPTHQRYRPSRTQRGRSNDFAMDFYDHDIDWSAFLNAEQFQSPADAPMYQHNTTLPAEEGRSSDFGLTNKDVDWSAFLNAEQFQSIANTPMQHHTLALPAEERRSSDLEPVDWSAFPKTDYVAEPLGMQPAEASSEGDQSS